MNCELPILRRLLWKISNPNSLNSTRILRHSWSVFDIAGKEKRAGELEQQAAQPDFWNDNVAAQQAMRELTALKDETTTWRELERRARDAAWLLDLAIEENHAEIAEEVEGEVLEIEAKLAALEFNLLFRRVRSQPRDPLDSFRRRRDRVARLGKDADADVSPLRRHAQISN